MNKSKKIKKAKCWMVYDTKQGFIGTFEKKKDAISNVEYAANYGHSQVVICMKFDKVVGD